MQSRPENKIHCTHQTQSRVKIIPFQRLIHVKHHERHEHRQRDDLLQDLQLSKIECGVTDTVGRHLQRILEQCDSPTDQRRHAPWRRCQILQVPIPCEGHEQIGHGEHQCRDQQRIRDRSHRGVFVEDLIYIQQFDIKHQCRIRRYHPTGTACTVSHA